MKNFIVLDINHGGDILSSILKDRGYNVIAYDIYQTRNDKRELLLQKNIKTITTLDKDYKDYIVVYPIHCPEYFLSFFPDSKKITHHELVKFLFYKNVNKNKIIEITGSKGKTTTSYVLSYLLSFNETVYLNSSRGFERLIKGRSEIIKSENSITPANTAKILSQMEDGLYVFEESLGVSGIGDVSILTSMDPIYQIKNGASNSFEAKKQIFSLSEGKIIVDGSDKKLRNIVDNSEKEIFQIWKDVSIEIPDKLEIGKNIESTLMWKEKESKVQFRGDYLITGYINSILFGALTLKILNINQDKISKYFSVFKGVENRQTVFQEKDYTKIIDKSGGFSEDSLRYLLSNLMNYYDMPYKSINLLIDLSNNSHCQKIKLEDIDKVIGEFNNFIDNAFVKGTHNFERFKYLRDSEELNIKKGDLLIESGKG